MGNIVNSCGDVGFYRMGSQIKFTEAMVTPDQAITNCFKRPGGIIADTTAVSKEDNWTGYFGETSMVPPDTYSPIGASYTGTADDPLFPVP